MIWLKQKTEKLRAITKDASVNVCKIVVCTSAICALGHASTALAQGVGYWHTSGNQILDAKDNPVRIAGINWYGFETTAEVAHGLYAQDYHTILKTIHDEGYNTIRMPYSNQMVEQPIVPTVIQFANSAGPINTDLMGLNSLEIMDKLLAAAGELGLKVILVNHRSEAGNSNEPSGLWYTSTYPEANWIADWQTLATRYKTVKDVSGNPVVIGVDLRNEPHLLASTGRTGSCWTGDSWTNGCPKTNTAQNWPAAAERAGKAVLAINPSLLIFVEGTDCYSGDCGWQGGNLEGAAKYPVTLPVANRLMYSAHDYGPDLSAQSWFSPSTTSASLQAAWTRYWAYLSLQGTAPVWLGEFGTTNATGDVKSNAAGSQGQWFSSLVAFLQNQPKIQWTYWALNGEDSFALIDGNYSPVPVSSIKQQMLASIQFPLKGLGGSAPPVNCTANPAAPAGVTATMNSSSSISLNWTAGTPPAGCSLTYNVYRSIAPGFNPGAGNLIATGVKTSSYLDSGLAASSTFYYLVRAVDSHGISASSAQVSAKTATPAAGTACHVVYSVSSTWSGGYQASLTITNTGKVAWPNWTLSWTFPGNQQITSFWNGTSTQTGQAVYVTNATYNGAIAPGASVTGIGFTANVTGTNAVPSNFVINGVTCK